ncbi:glycoside hydrolase family 44 protein [Paenibacillus methanolicus]|nr:glycoside hydrolase family 44 protein [Paenibacillus methanolicus]
MMNLAKRWSARRVLTPLTLAAAMLLAPLAEMPAKTYGDAPQVLAVYDDALSADFADYGWADKDLAESGTVHGGGRSIRMEPDEGQALYFYKDRVMNADEYESLRFWVHGGQTGGQTFKLVLSLGGQGVAEIDSSRLLPEGAPADEWRQVAVKLADYGVRGIIDGIWIWGGSGDQEALYLDDIAFYAKGGTEPSGEEPDPSPVAAVLFDQPQLVLKAGQLRAAALTAVHEDGTQKPVKEGAQWSSTNDAVATVSDGLVSAAAPGEAVVRASYAGFEAQLQVTVVEGTPAPPIEPVEGVYLFDDALGQGMTDYSWAEHSLSETDTVHTGEHSIRFAPDGDKALYFYSDRPLTTKEYEKLQLWVNGGAAGGQELRLEWKAGGQTVAAKQLSELLPEGIPAGEWAKVEIPLADLKLPDGLYDGLFIAGTGGGDAQPDVYLDDLALIAKASVQAKVAELRTDRPQLVMLPDEEQTLQAETFLSNGLTEIVTNAAEWTVDRPELLEVLPGGKLKALAPGIAKVTATYKTFAAETYVQVTEVEAEAVYGEELAEGFRNLSWHEKDFANREQAASGELSIKFEPDGWDGVWIAGDNKRSVEAYYGVRFAIHGGSQGGQQLLVHVYDGNSGVGAIDLGHYLPEGGLESGEWTTVTVNMADLGLSYGQFDGVIFQAATEANQGAVYIDDIALLRNLHAGELPEPQLPAVSVGVDASADRKPINPEIYGINFDDMHPTESELPFPVQRWGGNQMTRYNWELDTSNRANDWYYINYPNDNANPEQLPSGSTSDRFIDGVRSKGGSVLLTVPTIGWTPKDRTVSYGFSQQKYGAQQSGAQELPDAGNGVRPDGSLVTGNDPTDTSKQIGPEFVTRWMDHIASRTGEDGVNYYALDNEPEIWYVTHRDVHPEPPTYDELWNKTLEYGTAIKDKDPDAKLFGPVSWGWCAYFYSSADNCADGPDRQSHGGTPFLAWYLQQAARHEAQTGTRLVDYLDVHYYSQEDVVGSGEESPNAAKRRFQALKSLYDPNFIDNSWIQEPVRLIPRMKEIIAENLPGTKLAITEYNFGNGDGISAGLAQAEALAIFGREGVDLATRFGTLPAGTPLEDAFKLYLNYDGQGSRIEGTSVKAASSLHDAVGSYAIEGDDGKLYLLLFNKDTVSREVNASAGADRGGASAELYRFDAKSSLGAIGPAPIGAAGELSVKLPARSATLIVVD